MKQDILDRWVRALRSGKYKKICNVLRTKKGARHCGLGVLCDLHAIETGNKWNGESYLGEEGALPDKVVAWAGLPDNDPNLDDSVDSFVDFNDTRKCSFKELASLLIKAQKEGYLGRIIRRKPKKRKTVKEEKPQTVTRRIFDAITSDIECDQTEQERVKC